MFEHRRGPWFSRSVICFVALLCGHGSAEPPNVLLIVTDDQRPDTISALGNSVIQTPSLDELVRRGSTITRATCANPICVCSRAEILTGCSGVRNGVFGDGRTIDETLVTLPEPFAAAGYKTWYIGKWHNNGRPETHGYGRTHYMFAGGGSQWWKPQVDHRGHPVTGYKGWVFRDRDHRLLPEIGVGLTPRTSEVIADAAIDVINDSDGSPFFVHVNFTAPHDPLLIAPEFADHYDPALMTLPPNFLPRHPFDHGNQGGRDERLLPLPRTEEDVRRDIAAYYAVITHMDLQIGRILRAVDHAELAERTLIVFTSDHGLAIGSHGLRGKQNMYEHTIGVPLILVGPTIPRNRRFAAQAYLRDLMPTLCDLAGLEIPGINKRRRIDGRSLLPVLRGDQHSVYESVVGYFRDSQRMIRGDRWKLIEYPLVDRTQLFDLLADPYELTDQSGNPIHKPLLAKLRRAMHEQLAGFQR